MNADPKMARPDSRSKDLRNDVLVITGSCSLDT
jgi:hypothetical protein